MKFTIKAGAEMDLISRQELREELDRVMLAWQASAHLGGRYVPIRAKGTIDAAGGLTIGGSVGYERLGPADGYVWDVRRLSVVTTLNAADSIAVYVNEATPFSMLLRITQASGPILMDRQTVLYSGDNLLFVGAGMATTGDVIITGTVHELPVSLAWQLA